MEIGAETAIILGATAVKSGAELFGASEEEQALETRKAQEQLQAQQITNQRERKLEEITSTQEATEAARGVALSSPSFSAIQNDTFDQFAEDQRARNTQLLFQEANIDQEESNLKVKAFAAIAGNIFDAAKGSFTKTSTSKAPGPDDDVSDDDVSSVPRGTLQNPLSEESLEKFLKKRDPNLFSPDAFEGF